MVSIPSIAPLATSVASIDNTWILGRQIVINAPGGNSKNIRSFFV